MIKSQNLNKVSHLHNLIEAARNKPNFSVESLREILKLAAKDLPDHAVIRLSETLVKCELDMERAKVAQWN